MDTVQLVGNLFGFIIVIGAVIFVYTDAKKIGMDSPAMWAIGTFCFCLIVLPVYLFMRNKHLKQKAAMEGS